jgi:hypothetical protein
MKAKYKSKSNVPTFTIEFDKNKEIGGIESITLTDHPMCEVKGIPIRIPEPRISINKHEIEKL